MRLRTKTAPSNQCVLRVCIVSGHYPPTICGIGDHTRALAQALHRRGIEVHIITSRPSCGDPWEVIPIGDSWGWKTFRNVLTLIREIRPDIVHFQYQLGIYARNPFACFFPLMTSCFGRFPVVTVFHDLNGPKRWGRLHLVGVSAAILGSRWCIVCSGRQYHAAIRIPLLGRRFSQVAVGPTISPVGDLKPRVFKRKECWTVVCHGFVWRNRGLESVVRACGLVNQKGCRLLLVFAGGIVDEEHAQELKELAASSGLTRDQLFFTGELPAAEMSRVLYSADLCVLPFPTGVSTGRSTFFNCAAHGLPIITTLNQANLPRELSQGENVLLNCPGDDVELARHIESLCLSDALRAKLAENALKLAEHFSWENIARSYDEIYASLIQGRRRKA